MPKRGQNRRKRVPKLSFMATQGIGWHVSFRDPVTGAHGPSNAVTQWWNRLRESIDENRETLFGFHALRHLGVTEFGSRPGTSIGGVKRWLGHTPSSNVADLYVRPVRPEYREVVNWVRAKLTRNHPASCCPASGLQGTVPLDVEFAPA
jgi:integrase